VVTRANKSVEDYPPLFDAIGLLGSSDPDVVRQQIEARKAPTPDGKECRRRIHAAVQQKNYRIQHPRRRDGAALSQFASRRD
jgi:2,4-dichlorophenol 6-monooxygenase